MKIPVLRGLIDRRVLVNYRLDPEALTKVLPAPFRPKVVRGQGIAGICLIRLTGVRPRGMPACFGLRSENAAHRFAVEWTDAAGQVREGVYIPRRDTNSRLNALVGGRLFPGIHHHADFAVDERDDRLRIELTSDDGQTRLAVAGSLDKSLPDNSVFVSLEEASRFFEAGSLGYSATAIPGRFDGLELRCHNWSVRPLTVSHVRSSFFEDTSWFPAGSVRFDHALHMRSIAHEWHSQPLLCCDSNLPSAA